MQCNNLFLLMHLAHGVSLLARLDNDVGTGVHLTPTGIEFDERRLTLGDSTEVRLRMRLAAVSPPYHCRAVHLASCGCGSACGHKSATGPVVASI